MNTKSLTRAALTLASVVVLFGVVPAQNPGGVATPFYWSATEERSELSLPAAAADYLYIFAVYATPNRQEEVVWSISSADTTRQLLTNRRLVDLPRYDYLNFLPTESCGGPVLRTYLRQNQKTATAAKAATAERLHLRRHLGRPTLPASSLTGELLEVIVYTRPLDLREQQRIESYLAWRHGINLDQGTPKHYLSSINQPVWQATLPGAYRHRIFGLGLDLRSGLIRKTASSQTCGGELIELRLTDSEMPTRDFAIMVADNDRPTNLQGQRLARSWSVQASGDHPASVELSLRPRPLFTQLPPDNRWELLIDTSGTGAFEQPLRIAGRGNTYRLPVLKPHFHLSFAPARPFSEKSVDAAFSQVLVSPNPTQGEFQLRVGLKRAGPLVVSIYDGTGRLVNRRFRPSGTHHLLNERLTLPGLYHVRVESGDLVTHAKITVQ